MIKYKEEMWFPNLGTGKTYRFRFLAGILFLAVALDVFRVTEELILMLIFGIFGIFLTLGGFIKEVKRRREAKKYAAAFRANAVKTVGRILSCEGGVVRQSFSKYPDGPANSYGFFMMFEWKARVEFERKDGTLGCAIAEGWNKNPRKYVGKEVTVYYNGNKIYVEF